VRAARFREDLFYRLNVVRLHIPPLRERPEDVRLLAEHFARTAAAEQRKGLLGFTPEAERHLAAYTWPGNIRELQNTILQAVVLSDADRLDAADLKLAVAPGLGLASPIRQRLQPVRVDVDVSDAGVQFEQAWQALRGALEDEVRRAASAVPRVGLPLGRWLAHEVVLVAHEHSGGVGARAAGRIGLPQTTFARRLRQAMTDRGLTSRPPTWTAVRSALSAAVAAPDLPSEGLADRAESLLLEVVLAHAPAPIGYAAALMGFSPPTMKQRLAARAAS
jgi:DNA-binding NtrC family response regulator